MTTTSFGVIKKKEKKWRPLQPSRQLEDLPSPGNASIRSRRFQHEQDQKQVEISNLALARGKGCHLTVKKYVNQIEERRGGWRGGSAGSRGDASGI